jgi:hypothetical protein
MTSAEQRAIAASEAIEVLIVAVLILRLFACVNNQGD